MRYTDYLASLEKFGINLGLDRITYLLESLGNPHRKFKSIHIAGTNGKGSTAAMIASILKEAGYKVGLYTSPHLFDFRERIKINAENISRRDFSRGLKIVKKLAREPRSQPTVFEALTAVAFWYFAKKKVDYAVVEVGLGGRLDATNVLHPLVAIITNIDYEHTEVLGKRLSKIAAEKAAIIKPGIPVVTAESKNEPLKVIRKVCRKKASLLIAVSSKQTTVSGVLVGKHQKTNAACAISAVRLARIKVTKAAIRRGLQKTDWPGRFQIVSKKPLIVVDGAHNPAGVKALRVTIQETFGGKHTVVFGCQKTKDFKKILKELKPIASNIIITKSSHRLAADPKDISSYLKRQRMPACATTSLDAAIAKWDKKKPLLITGSLFTVSDALKILDVPLQA
jgi:dihydrofolate synthase/folylpolyglutamate synthase